jgi:hypothetical protein
MLGSSMTVFAEDQSKEDYTMSTSVSYVEEGTFTVSIPKRITLEANGKNATGTYTVKVVGDIPSSKKVYVAPIDGIESDSNDDIDFYLKDQNTSNAKSDVVAKITQTKTYWDFNDVSGEGTSSTDNTIVASNVSAGSWMGTFNFKINLHTHDWVESNVVNATCSKTGSKTLTCSTCGDVEENVEIDTIDHNFGDNGMEAYCAYGCGTVNSNIIVDTLNGYTWSEVKAICEEGNAKEYFSVGDIAVISLDELPNASNTTSAQNATVVVGDITNTSLTLLITGYSTLAPTHVMNTTMTNIDGWALTSMRSWLNGEYYSALSSDLQNAIIDHSSSYSSTYNASNVSYCDDKVWLLSSKEVFGGGTATNAGSNTTYCENLAAFNAETQLAYFANGASRVRYSSGTSPCWWWLRSSNYSYSNSFTYVCSDGSSNYGGAYRSSYVFPAFCIG